MNKNAQGFVAGLTYVLIAVIFGAITIWGFLNLNVIVATLGSVAEGSWIIAAKHII